MRRCRYHATLSFLTALGIAVGVAHAAETAEKQTDWCTLRCPQTAAVGETVEVEITLADGAIPEAGRMRLDMHWFSGRKRAGVAGHAKPMAVAPDGPKQHVVQMKIPDKPGIAAVAFAVYVSKDGEYTNKWHGTEISCRVVARSDTAGGAPPAQTKSIAAPAPMIPVRTSPVERPVPELPTAADLPVGAWEEPRCHEWGPEVGQDAVEVEGPADIAWQPAPFRFEAGATIRYIDFEAGSDTNPGTREQPWKHHPWDAAATDRSAAFAGVATYVFKCGVVYRGNLVAAESGTAGEPIRLTSDPSWGDGQATLAASEPISGGWAKLSEAKAAALGFPTESHGHIWTIDLGMDFTPRLLWEVRDGVRVRMPIAREPDWNVSELYRPFDEWWRWKTAKKGFPTVTCSDPEHLNDPDPRAYVGATVFSGQPNTSGEFSITSPLPARVKRYNPETGSVSFDILHPARHPADNSVYYLEGLPRFLDQPGEWFVSENGDDSGRLYLRSPEDRDPDLTMIEAARHKVLIELTGVKHVEVCGLTLTGVNCPNPHDTCDVEDYTKPQPNSEMAAVRLVGACQDINLHHLRVSDASGGIVNLISSEGDLVDGITIADCEFRNLDSAAIDLRHGYNYRKLPFGKLTGLRILRNRVSDVGLRNVGLAPQGIQLDGVEVAEVAGNVVERTGAQGINIHAGRPTAGWSSGKPEAPLIRIRVHHNRVNDSLLHVQDFGGIECWGTGSDYVYSNISTNAVGWVAHKKRGWYHKNELFYFDHNYKGWLFSNIGWSVPYEDAYQGTLSNNLFHLVYGQMNTAFHNTVSNTRGGLYYSGGQQDGSQVLGNLLTGIPLTAHSLWALRTAEDIGWAGNVHHGETKNVFSIFRQEDIASIDDFRSRLAGLPNVIAGQVGWGSDAPLVRDPVEHDFRPTDDSPAIDRGVKVFVPWALYGVVGEWNFYRSTSHPGWVRSYDLYPAEYHKNYRTFQELPNNDLSGDGFVVDDYARGPLESWTDGALCFDGNKHLVLSHERLVADFDYAAGKEVRETYPGEKRRTVQMQANSFLIEMVGRIEPGHAGGTVAGKLAEDRGYALQTDDAGRAVLALRAGGDTVEVHTDVAVNDDLWHHLVAECDRPNRRVRIYLDGRLAADGMVDLAADATLGNTEDFVVGKGLVGAIDFLRVSRGTLADARTDIAELCAWQFDGPALRDITGRRYVGTSRDAGAIEHPTATGRKPVRYTPPAPEDEGIVVAEATDTEDVIATETSELEWCTVRYPASAAVGEKAPVTVTIKPEAFTAAAKLRMDMHWFEGRTRKTGGPRSGLLRIPANQAASFTHVFTVPDKPNIAAMAIVLYAGPTGGWDDKLYTGSVGIKVLQEAREPATAKEPEEKAPRPADEGIAPETDAGEIETKVLDWGTFSITKRPEVGQTAVVTVTLADGVVTEPTVLTVDMHWWRGRERVGALGRFGRKQIGPGEGGPFVFRKTVPDKEGIAAIAGTVSLSPDGSWGKHTHAADIGTLVSAGGQASVVKPTASTQASPTPAQTAGGRVRLFVLSGQSNMVGLNPDDTFLPRLRQCFPDDELIVVKDAENGQAIQRWYRRGTRDLYQRLLEKMRAAAENKTLASATFVWMQGESDATPEFSGLYEKNLTSLIGQLRSDLGREDMTVVIGRISDCRKGQEDWDKVRDVQVKVAESDPLAGWVQTDDLNGEDNDMHYREKSARDELGRRFAAKAIELITKTQDQ